MPENEPMYVNLEYITVLTPEHQTTPLEGYLFKIMTPHPFSICAHIVVGVAESQGELRQLISAYNITKKTEVHSLENYAEVEDLRELLGQPFNVKEVRALNAEEQNELSNLVRFAKNGKK